MSGVTLVTGASRGIGAATAALAASRGHAVCVNYVREREVAEALVEEIRRSGGSAIAVQADVSVEADVDALFTTTERELGPVTTLVNNAGIVAPASRLEDMEASRLSRMLAVNVIGVMLCAREAVRRMASGGAIVNVSSALVRNGAPGNMIDYAASKGAVETFTRGLALEVADRGIRVNAVRAGIIVTGIGGPGTEAQRADRGASMAPMKRAGDAEEVARAILWLASPESSYSTGAILDVSGGI
jgi:NAD(P)-dependent dehydrogenase (short-subunit alcohol dehydrogenase family)